MSDPKQPPKDGESFFRKVVRFVANPTTEWSDINTVATEPRESEYAKSELKAMIERKRRNDFVRKREFDMLRRIRREGLTGDQISGLAGLSNLDDSEARVTDAARPDGVKEKIDEIEQQMVGDAAALRAAARRPANVPTGQPSLNANAAALNESFLETTAAPRVMPPGEAPPRSMNGASAQAPGAAAGAASGARPAESRAGARSGSPGAASPPAVVVMGPGVSPLSPLNAGGGDMTNPFAVEVNELAHDPDLDEAVIAFANADFEQCEQALRALVSAGGSRSQHAETWLVLFDLYRATGQQNRFESLALDYAHQFGWSAPQWFSLPKLVADAAAAAAASGEQRQGSGSARVDGAVGWVAPAVLDAEEVARLRSQLLQMPLPWVLEWSALQRIDPEACHSLRELLRSWAHEPLEMRWLAGDRLLAVLSEAAPVSVRDVDPEYWLLRLEILRMANRPDHFDEVAIDYCVTYEVSPPSYEPAKAMLRLSTGASITAAQLSHVSEVSTGFVESEIEDAGMLQVSSIELSGQLVGDIGALLKSLEGKLGTSSIVNVSCARLIRMDFVAAGDLLNWVLARRSENRAVTFEDANRLVALFCGAMGINEHARVKVRNV